jgi:hypothetical protein
MERKILKSGEFLVSNIESKDIFIPEEFDEEQRMIAQTCHDFLEAEVYPKMTDLEKGDRALMKQILKKSGELGIMGISVPEEFGGFGQSFVTQMLVAETTGAGYSFSVAYMAHCGIGTLPILYYGMFQSLLPVSSWVHIALLNPEQAVMQIQGRQMRNSLTTENIISLTDKRCGSQMQVLLTLR